MNVSREMAKIAGHALSEKKAENVRVIDKITPTKFKRW